MRLTYATCGTLRRLPFERAGANVDIAAWLRELGLERYIDVFEANDIDATLLCTLNADDLKELGVRSLGHRKILLGAIAALATEPAAAQPSVTVAAAEPGDSGPGRRGAERRQLTIMFVDLVSSTALATRLDPEDMSEVLRVYHENCTRAITRWDGHIARYMGDGVLAYSAGRERMRTTPSAPCAPGWSSLRPWASRLRAMAVGWPRA
jgi:hypothetical protein